jgi:diguanylate cyclase (GGDEF)-like protein/PAS domain S-box-containing protein
MGAGKAKPNWQHRRISIILRFVNERLIPCELMYEYSPTGILVADAGGKVVDFNPSEQHLLGYHRDDLVGKPVEQFVAAKDRQRFLQALEKAGQNIESEIEVDIIHRSGQSVPILRKIHAYYENDSLTGFIIHSIDITERRHLIEQLRRQAETDQMTGLRNRRSFLKQADHSVRYARRYGSELALLFVDLNKFKEANDTYGHDAGDRIIISVAERIRSSVRDTDLAARLGGDEFVILLSGDRVDTRSYAERLHHAIIQPIEFGSEMISSIGASIGVARFPEDGEDLDSLMKLADQAMYASKSSADRSITYWHERD